MPMPCARSQNARVSQNSIFGHARAFSPHAWCGMARRCCRRWMAVAIAMPCDDYDAYASSEPLIIMSMPCVCSQNARVPKLNIWTRARILASCNLLRGATWPAGAVVGGWQWQWRCHVMAMMHMHRLCRLPSCPCHHVICACSQKYCSRK